jgi:hypothetical protein
VSILCTMSDDIKSTWQEYNRSSKPFADPPDSVPLHECIGDERYGRLPFNKSQNPFTCGLTGRTYTHVEMRERHELLARSLSKRMGWQPNEDTPWDKVVGLYSLNTVSSE